MMNQGRRRRSVLASSCSAAAAAVDWGQGRRRRTLFQSPLGFFAATIDSATARWSRKGRGGHHQTRRHQLQPSRKPGQTHQYSASSFLESESTTLAADESSKHKAMLEIFESTIIQIVYLLLESGVDINLRNYHGQTALMQACQHGHWEVVQTLILVKANSKQPNQSFQEESKEDNLCHAKRMRVFKSQSAAPAVAKQVTSKEKIEDRRYSLRKESEKFNAEKLEPAEDNFSKEIKHDDLHHQETMANENERTSLGSNVNQEQAREDTSSSEPTNSEQVNAKKNIEKKRGSGFLSVQMVFFVNLYFK
ncbi:putative E3 ubiquitin-protein ligase [Arachis hypogaea]|nr:putative E3 ubiquitin-protein ligase [Arachis hypogaea]